MKNKYLGVILIYLLMVINISVSYAKIVPSDEISIIVPRDVIINMLKAALPLNIEKGPYLKGALWIHTIDRLKIGSNKVGFDMNIRGKNIKFETQLGNQALLMDIGNLTADFACSVSLRYDASKRLLYVTPHILQKPNKNKEDKIAATLLSLLSLGNGMEYPVEIKKFQPFITQISSNQFTIDMDIMNIYTENDRVVITGQPKLTKVRPKSPPKQKSE